MKFGAHHPGNDSVKPLEIGSECVVVRVVTAKPTAQPKYIVTFFFREFVIRNCLPKDGNDFVVRMPMFESRVAMNPFLDSTQFSTIDDSVDLNARKDSLQCSQLTVDSCWRTELRVLFLVGMKCLGYLPVSPQSSFLTSDHSSDPRRPPQARVRRRVIGTQG